MAISNVDFTGLVDALSKSVETDLYAPITSSNHFTLDDGATTLVPNKLTIDNMQLETLSLSSDDTLIVTYDESRMSNEQLQEFAKRLKDHFANMVIMVPDHVKFKRLSHKDRDFLDMLETI